MRKIILAAAIVLALGAISFGVALANGGPHGGYSITTDACAGCHRAHTAVGEALLVEGTIQDLCYSCHSGAGSGSTLNVDDGVLRGTGSRLNGGGFTFVAGAAATSAHNTGTELEATAWGGASSGEGAVGVLECTSCHNPHGSTNYRILKDADNGYPYGPANAWKHRWDYVDGVTQYPTQTNTLDWASNQVLPTNNLQGGVNQYSTPDYANYTQGMNSFCATCHKSYLTASGSAGQPSTTTGGSYFYPGTQDAGDGWGDIARYRHAVSRTANPGQYALRFSAAGNDPTTTGRTGFVCTTCHFTHGTSATASGFAAGVAPTNDSALLYYPNRGVCNSCHQKGK